MGKNDKKKQEDRKRNKRNNNKYRRLSKGNRVFLRTRKLEDRKRRNEKTEKET